MTSVDELQEALDNRPNITLDILPMNRDNCMVLLEQNKRFLEWFEDFARKFAVFKQEQELAGYLSSPREGIDKEKVLVDRKQLSDFDDFVESYFKDWEMSYKLQGSSCEIFLAEVIGFIGKYRREKELLADSGSDEAK